MIMMMLGIIVMNNVTVNDCKLVEEYKNYIINNIMATGFTFDTWAEHQYGVKLDIDVKPIISFDVIGCNNINK